MKLLSISVMGVKKFLIRTTFDFSEAGNVNTISGKNGSGKTTIADAMLLLQQAFFLELIEEQFRNNSFASIARNEFIGKLNDSMCNRSAIVSVTFGIEDDVIGIELVANRNGLSLNWELRATEEEKEKLRRYWNLENPTNIILYIESNKHYDETNTPFSEVNIKTTYELPVSREAWLTLNMIYFPTRTFHMLYKNLLMDWAYERLIPTKGKQDLYFKLGSFLFNQLFPHIRFKNFSANNFRSDEVVALVSNDATGGSRYDLRQLSSGEKTVFYLFLYLNLVGRISLLIIDEPENHLHEDLILKFVTLLFQLGRDDINYKQVLNELNLPNNLAEKVDTYMPQAGYNKISQTILMTHSKILIYSAFDLGNNFILNEDGLSILEYDRCERTLRELGISSIYNKVLFVEGDKEVEFLESLAVENNVKIEKVGNCRKMIEIYSGLKDVERHLTESYFVFLLDRDVTNDERVSEFIDNEEFILLDRHEIENYLLDESVWLEAAKSLASDDQQEELTLDLIKSDLKTAADRQLDVTKKQYVTNKIRDLISDFQTEVRHRDVNIASETEFQGYTDALLSGPRLEQLKDKINSVYSLCEEKYSIANWEENWISLCPGKQVLLIASNTVGNRIGVTQNRFLKEIEKISKRNTSAPLYVLLGSIKDKLEIN
ncbi:TPA: AAA family ATPase [Bacillus thuringiensis]|nr:AAA family ATPase [Bacillus thuringiensis]